MYVCICNAVNERRFNEAALRTGEAGSVSGVFRELGCTPRCGACVTDMRERLTRGRLTNTTASAEKLLLAAD